MRNAILLGIDPGFASFGYAALCLAPPPSDRIRVNSIGVFETEKASKKAHVLATEDNLKRAREIAAFLEEWIASQDNERNRVIAICAESMSWPRNASVTAKMGITWGVIAAVARALRIPIFQASPQEVKKTVTGFKSAKKEDVALGVGKRVAALVAGRQGFMDYVNAIEAIPQTKQEHPIDALAVAMTCARADAIQIARRSLT